MIKYREISGLIFLKNLIKELKQLLKIGIPIYGSQISYMGMGVTDTIVAGQASALDINAGYHDVFCWIVNEVNEKERSNIWCSFSMYWRRPRNSNFI